MRLAMRHIKCPSFRAVSTEERKNGTLPLRI
nr:MAG TPA: hypothetical protein [Caudoviricetes sp.]